MKYKPIIIVAGEPNSIFSEIFLKAIKNKKFKSPLILICSKKLFFKQSRALKQKIDIHEIKESFFLSSSYKKQKLNMINVNLNQSKIFEKISSKSNKYIENCFKIGLKLLKSGISEKLINGPISKESFLKNKYNGITEYLAYKTKSKKIAMIIYNKKLSVCPITTHIPIKYVTKKISKVEIINKVKLISLFWKKKFNKKVKIAVTGLNPHCESIDKFKEDKKIILPTINYLKKKGFNIYGPFPGDTLFLKKNREKYDLIIGMYHDQVLTPIKTLFEYEAINLTLGLPFIRVSPDHGPNENMVGKNSSNYLSMLRSIQFLDY
tara:strand:- start:303 stop:1265 length:963 start_codon:yes stop_codon:yes gene_type:complete